MQRWQVWGPWPAAVAGWGVLFSVVLTLSAANPAHADSCGVLGGSINGAGECEVSSSVSASGTFLLAETLHFVSGGKIVVSPVATGLEIDIAGSLIMDAGS